MNTVAGSRGGDMEPIGDLCGMIEVFVQGVDVLENTTAPAYDEIVDRDDVLGVFGEGDAADMLETPHLSN